MAGTRRTNPFAGAGGADKAGGKAGGAADAGEDEESLGSFTCLRIDGSVTTPVRYVTVRYPTRTVRKVRVREYPLVELCFAPHFLCAAKQAWRSSSSVTM